MAKKKSMQAEKEQELVMQMNRYLEEEETTQENDVTDSDINSAAAALPDDETEEENKKKKDEGNKSSKAKLTEEEKKKLEEKEEELKKAKEQAENEKAKRVVKNIGKSKLYSMTEIELAQYFLKLCYDPASLVTGEPGFESVDAVVKSFYQRFGQMDKTSQQYVENRFQFEVERMGTSQQMYITNSAVRQALYEREAQNPTLLKDTVSFVTQEKIGTYSSASEVSEYDLVRYLTALDKKSPISGRNIGDLETVSASSIIIDLDLTSGLSISIQDNPLTRKMEEGFDLSEVLIQLENGETEVATVDYDVYPMDIQTEDKELFTMFTQNVNSESYNVSNISVTNNASGEITTIAQVSTNFNLVNEAADRAEEIYAEGIDRTFEGQEEKFVPDMQKIKADPKLLEEFNRVKGDAAKRDEFLRANDCGIVELIDMSDIKNRKVARKIMNEREADKDKKLAREMNAATSANTAVVEEGFPGAEDSAKRFSYDDIQKHIDSMEIKQKGLYIFAMKAQVKKLVNGIEGIAGEEVATFVQGTIASYYDSQKLYDNDGNRIPKPTLDSKARAYIGVESAVMESFRRKGAPALTEEQRKEIFGLLVGFNKDAITVGIQNISLDKCGQVIKDVCKRTKDKIKPKFKLAKLDEAKIRYKANKPELEKESERRKGVISKLRSFKREGRESKVFQKQLDKTKPMIEKLDNGTSNQMRTSILLKFREVVDNVKGLSEGQKRDMFQHVTRSIELGKETYMKEHGGKKVTAAANIYSLLDADKHINTYIERFKDKIPALEECKKTLLGDISKVELETLAKVEDHMMEKEASKTVPEQSAAKSKADEKFAKAEQKMDAKLEHTELSAESCTVINKGANTCVADLEKLFNNEQAKNNEKEADKAKQDAQKDISDNFNSNKFNSMKEFENDFERKI